MSGLLEKFLNDVPDRHPPLVKAALAHLQFETIPPFLDGNGRVGRLLIPPRLVHGKVLQEPLLYLSLYFKRDRARAAIGRQAASTMRVFHALARRPVRSTNSICADAGRIPVAVATALGRLDERLGQVRELTGERLNRVFGYVAHPDTLNREALFDAAAA